MAKRMMLREAPGRSSLRAGAWPWPALGNLIASAAEHPGGSVSPGSSSISATELEAKHLPKETPGQGEQSGAQGLPNLGRKDPTGPEDQPLATLPGTPPYRLTNHRSWFSQAT